jgi:hypothetical protein
LFLENPCDVFLRNAWINPFWDDDLEGLIPLMGADHILFGSHSPHPECTAEPLNWLKQIADFYPARDEAQLMDENLYGLLGR